MRCLCLHTVFTALWVKGGILNENILPQWAPSKEQKKPQQQTHHNWVLIDCS